MPELSPIRQIVDNHPSQGQMLHISHQHARCAEDRPAMSRFRNPYVLDSPIRIQSSARVEKQQSFKFDRHDYSGILENENANVPLSTPNNQNFNDKNTQFTRFSVPT
jgi:hypothetical protein